jgi:WD40 repeat protein
MALLYTETRTPLRPEKFQASFSKLRTTAYHDTTHPRPIPQTASTSSTLLPGSANLPLSTAFSSPSSAPSGPAAATASSGPAATSVLRTLAWSPLGNYVATGSGDRRLRVWNPERAQVRHSTELRGHLGAVERVAWHPAREAELASCSADGGVRVWDVRSKGNVGEVRTGRDCFTLCWSPDGREMVVGTKVGFAEGGGKGADRGRTTG